MKPIFSIIIPVYNREETIAALLTSLFDCNLPFPIEVIIINSGSTDRTKEIIRKFNDKRITIVDIKKEEFNHGLTRNLGVERSSGTYVYFFSGDAQIISKDIFTRALSYFQAYSNCAIVFAKQIPYDTTPIIQKLETTVYFDDLDTYVDKNGIILQTITKPFIPFNEENKMLWYFSSDVAACYKKSFLTAYPFPKTEYGGEDVFAARIALEKGYSKIYDSKIVVQHSHNYSFLEYIKREKVEMELVVEKLKTKKKIRLFGKIKKIIRQNNTTFLIKTNYFFVLFAFYIVKIFILIFLKLKRIIILIHNFIRQNNFFQHDIPIVLAILLSFLYYFPILKSGNNLGIQDFDQNLAWSEFTRLSILKYYQFPFWNPYICGGSVHFANPQVSVISLQTLFVLLFGALAGIKISIFIHGVIGFIGFYFLGRQYKLSKWGSVIAATIFSFSGITGSFLSTGMVVFMNFSYSPYILFFFNKGIKNIKILIVSSALFAFSYYMSYQIPLLLFTYIVIYCVVECFLNKNLRTFVSLVIFSVASVIFALPKLALSLELFSYFPRLISETSGYKFINFIYFLFSRKQNLYSNMDIKGWFYSIDENSMYVGVSSLIFFVIFFIKNKKEVKDKLILIYTLIIMIIFMLGNTIRPSLYGLLHQLPIFSSFRVPERFRFNFIIPFSLIIGLGFDNYPKLFPKIKEKMWRYLNFGVVLLLFVDLATFSSSNFLSKVFIIKNNFVENKNLNFFQYKEGLSRKEIQYTAKLPYYFYGKPTFLPWSYEYEMLRNNKGTINCYDPIPFEKSPTGIDEGGYKGEYYVLPLSKTSKIVQKYWSPNFLSYEITHVSTDATLVINQNYFPGWYVRSTNGEYRAALNSNGLLSAKINNKSSKIAFVFLPYKKFTDRLIEYLSSVQLFKL